MRVRDFLLIALAVILLAACSTPRPFDKANDPVGDTQPYIDDPDANINVTPQPEERICLLHRESNPPWCASPQALAGHASGEIYLKVAVNSDMTA